MKALSSTFTGGVSHMRTLFIPLAVFTAVSLLSPALASAGYFGFDFTSSPIPCSVCLPGPTYSYGTGPARGAYVPVSYYAGPSTYVPAVYKNGNGWHSPDVGYRSPQ